MKLKRRVVIITFLLVILLSMYMILSNLLSSNGFENIFKTVNKNRLENRVSKVHEIDSSKYTFDEINKYELGISEEQLKYINLRYSITEDGRFEYKSTNINTDDIILSKEQAISDIEFLFNALKYSYAAYIYFGGDEVWNRAKNSIINSINLKEESISSKELEQIIFNELSFVQDGHFSINFNSPLKKSYYFYSEEFEIHKDENGYYINQLNNKFYIKSINNDENLENYIKLSLNKEGELCYYIGFVSDVEYFGRVKLILESEDVEQIMHTKVERNLNDYIFKYTSTNYNCEKINGTPVYTMRKMYNIDSNDKSVELFGESAKEIKDKEVVIIDIRGNTGGNDFGPRLWFENLTGRRPNQSGTFIQFNSLLNNNLIRNVFIGNRDNADSNNPAIMYYDDLLIRTRENENKWDLYRYSNDEIYNNKTKIFVLIDKNVASSGETFVGLLNSIENVMFIGTNTSGVGICDASNECILPNSKINFIYGSTMSLHDNQEEGVGYKPDIWIGGNNSLERVLNFIN